MTIHYIAIHAIPNFETNPKLSEKEHTMLPMFPQKSSNWLREATDFLWKGLAKISGEVTGDKISPGAQIWLGILMGFFFGLGQ